MTQKKPFNILVISGVNLDLLGTREPGVYGSATLKAIEERLSQAIPQLEGWYQRPIQLQFFQSNHEGVFLEKLGEKAWDGIVMNPGAWTHTSLALADRLKALQITFAEVHISNIAAREAFRHHSYSAPHAAGVVYGFGPSSYLAGLLGLLDRLTASTS